MKKIRLSDYDSVKIQNRMRSSRPNRMRQRREMKLKTSFRRVAWVSSALVGVLAIGLTLFFNFHRMKMRMQRLQMNIGQKHQTGVRLVHAEI